MIVADGSSRAGEINRLAFESGVTVNHLAERERTLEDAYFALTGTHSGDVEDRGALGGDPMIVAAFRSEWVKLRRPNLLVGCYGGLALAASLFAILLFAQAPAKGWRGPPEPRAVRPTQRAHPWSQPSRSPSRDRGVWDRCNADRE